MRPTKPSNPHLPFFLANPGIRTASVFFHKLVLLLYVLLFLGIPGVKGQQNIDYSVYANIIYRITKYINWPPEKKEGNFVIGIVGDSPLYNEIQSFTTNKTVGNQKIIIKTFSSSASSYDCHILFISEDRSRSLKKIVAATIDSPVLIISEAEGLAQQGSCINFIIEDDHLKLEINKNNIENRNLSVASEFLGLGKIVK
jgi:hypothetical protein